MLPVSIFAVPFISDCLRQIVWSDETFECVFLSVSWYHRAIHSTLSKLPYFGTERDVLIKRIGIPRALVSTTDVPGRAIFTRLVYFPVLKF